MAIARSTWVDDSGLGSDGSVQNNAELQKIYDNIDANTAVIATTAVGTQNNFNPGIAGLLTVVRCANASLLTITGFPAGFNGQQILLYADVAQVDLSHADAGSTAGNKLANIVTSGKTSLALGGSAWFVYSTTAAVWRLLNHEQGAWIAFTPTWVGSVTQPVIGNGVFLGRYLLRGKTVWMDLHLIPGSTTTFGSGTYTFGLPPITAADINGQTGAVFMYHAGVCFAGSILIAGGTSIAIWGSGGGQMSPTVPFTFANADQLRVSMSYVAT